MHDLHESYDTLGHLGSCPCSLPRTPCMVLNRPLIEEFSTDLAGHSLVFAVYASHMNVHLTRIMKSISTYLTLVIFDFVVNSFDMLPKVRCHNKGLITYQADDLLRPVMDSFHVTFNTSWREIFVTYLAKVMFDL